MFSLTRTRHFLSLVLIWAALVTALLPLWHHHDEEACGHEERECVVCVAALLPLGDGVAVAHGFVSTENQVGKIETKPISVLQIEFLPVLWACGPPNSCT